MTMMTMSTVRAGLKAGDLGKVMQFLEIIADATKLKQLTEELEAQIKLAEAEQAKALEYAGSQEKLKQANQLLEQANAANGAAKARVDEAQETARGMIDDARAQARTMIEAAHEDVTQIRGDIDIAQAAADAAAAEAQDKLAQAKEIHRSAKEVEAEAAQARDDMNRRLEEMRRLAS